MPRRMDVMVGKAAKSSPKMTDLIDYPMGDPSDSILGGSSCQKIGVQG